jgi:hypothetical protein
MARVEVNGVHTEIYGAIVIAIEFLDIGPSHGACMLLQICVSVGQMAANTGASLAVDELVAWLHHPMTLVRHSAQ